MKEKIILILKEVYLNLGIKDEFFDLAADKILHMAEFEALCNPNIFEANANEHLKNEAIHKAAYDACMSPSQPNGEPEPEHSYYDAFTDGAWWAFNYLGL